MKKECVMVTKSGEEAKKSKETGVKFVRPEYIEVCYETNAKLDENDYKPIA
jgi:hypothetical protein